MFIIPADNAFLSFSLFCFCFVVEVFQWRNQLYFTKVVGLLTPSPCPRGTNSIDDTRTEFEYAQNIYQFHKNVQGKEADLNRKVKTHSRAQREKERN